MKYRIVDNVWNELKDYTSGDNYILITDDNIYCLYKDKIDNLIMGRNNIHLIKSGEANKNLTELARIYDKLIESNIDRKGIILALGGGMVGDMAGFAASTYKRGINYIQIPTTLLAQVDSSIGGKTAIDHAGFKNIIGSFYFPLETLIDLNFLMTLSSRELTSGIGEVIKYGIIADYGFFEYIKENLGEIYEKNTKVLYTIVKESVELKSSIVENDVYDSGIRQKLNFGHTIGHSIEAYFNYEKYYHGEAVILGMLLEANMAYIKKFIDYDYYKEIKNLLLKLIKPYEFSHEEVSKLMQIMQNDKKNKDGKIAFILPVAKGEVEIFYDLEETIIREAFFTYNKECNII